MGRGGVDTGVFYRFLRDDSYFWGSGIRALIPFMFLEYTKNETKGIAQKCWQGSIHANCLLDRVKFEQMDGWVPVLGVIMSESEMLFRLYIPTVLEGETGDKEWKLAEVDVMNGPLSIERLVHVMVDWVQLCAEYAKSPPPWISVPTRDERIQLQLPRAQQNVFMLPPHHVYKCYDYRYLSEKSFTPLGERRSPNAYFAVSGLAGLEMCVDWKRDTNVYDSLQIIRYNIVPGIHCPSTIGHFILVVAKLQEIHQKGYVHGDMRFLNVIFSSDQADETEQSQSKRPRREVVIASGSAASSPAAQPPYQATIIDYDLSGRAGMTCYPPRFNRQVGDGQRHPGAVPGAALQPEHDRAAVLWMCEQFRPKKEALRAQWARCVASLAGELTTFGGALQALAQEEVEILDDTLLDVFNIRQNAST